MAGPVSKILNRRRVCIAIMSAISALLPADKFKSNSDSDSVDLALALTILNCGLSFLPVFNTSRNDLAEA